MKTVSIALATYNGARFIGDQLESFARQTRLPDELVVTDDSSTDGTLDIITAFAARAPFPVRVEKNIKRLGYRANFMKAAQLCQSDLISFSDQDDVWHPGKLKACVAAFGNPDVLMVYHNATVVNERLEPTGVMGRAAAPQAFNPPMSLEPWQIAAWGFTTVIDRSLLELQDLWPLSIDFFAPNEKDKHDQWFLFLASCLGTIAYLSEPLALYRQHDRNVVGFGSATSLRGKLDILLSNDLAGIKIRELSAGRRAAVLEKARDKLGGIHALRAGMAAQGYRRLEASYRGRLDMYASESVFSRTRQFARLAQSGGYRPRDQWGAGREAMIRDILRGVCFPVEAEHAEEAKVLNV